jgi:hypothetical protein
MNLESQSAQDEGLFETLNNAWVFTRPQLCLALVA